MKAVIQKVKNASVTVKDEVIGKIDNGFMILLGVGQEDTEERVDYLVNKICNLRVFEDEKDKMNLSIHDVEGQLLVISQFTLYANCQKGNRPSFVEAALPEKTERLYEYFIKKCKEQIKIVEHGKFGAHMQVTFTNDGPVTILLEK